eukprot:1611985-Rhodomonas_salina.2
MDHADSLPSLVQTLRLRILLVPESAARCLRCPLHTKGDHSALRGPWAHENSYELYYPGVLVLLLPSGKLSF